MLSVVMLNAAFYLASMLSVMAPLKYLIPFLDPTDESGWL
jgi:hypothetical protein